MKYLDGLSYGHSLAYPHFSRVVKEPLVRKPEMLALALELIHVGHFKALPPCPKEIAARAVMAGIFTEKESSAVVNWSFSPKKYLK